MAPHVVVFGMGYSGTVIAAAAAARGWRVTGVSRDPGAAPPGVALVAFAAAGAALEEATHLVATAPPDAGDPVLARHGAAIAAAPWLRWAGYLSTTGVYGDRDGAWVDEDTPPAPGAERSRRRLAAEREWEALAARRPPPFALDLFRLAGIYGPGRSAFDALRAGTARRVVKPGHAFGRIHRHDIAAAVVAGMATATEGRRVLHLSDSLPAEAAEVTAEAARLLGQTPPPAIPYAEAAAAMSPMARSFWAENRKVACDRTLRALGIAWRYPTYREGLRAILLEEAGQGPA